MLMDLGLDLELPEHWESDDRALANAITTARELLDSLNHHTGFLNELIMETVPDMMYSLRLAIRVLGPSGNSVN
jgi:hypothetical protein